MRSPREFLSGEFLKVKYISPLSAEYLQWLLLKALYFTFFKFFKLMDVLVYV